MTPEPSNRPVERDQCWLIGLAEISALVIILALAAYVRLENVAENPHWYTDEGALLNISANLRQGHLQYMSTARSFFLSGRMPLFPLVLAGVESWVGAGMGTLRALCGWLGVISVGLLYLLVRRVQRRAGAGLALLAALMLAIYPQAVVYTRVGFSYNLLTPLVILTCRGLWEYLGDERPGWLVLASLCIGVGILSDVLMAILLMPLVLVVSARRWRDLAWSLPLAAAPVSVYALATFINAPDAFLFDARFILFRFGPIPWMEQLPTAAFNYLVILQQDGWWALAMVGLLLLRPVRWQRLIWLMLLVPFVAVSRTVSLIVFGWYYLSPLFPWVALGVATLVWYGMPRVVRLAREGLESLWQRWGWRPSTPQGRWLQTRLLAVGSSVIVFWIVVIPFLLQFLLLAYQVQTGLRTRMDAVMVAPRDAWPVAEFVNANVGSDDLVIASPTLAWMYHAHVADFQFAIAATGKATTHLPANIPPERFAYDVRYTQARFVVIDNTWRNWAILSMQDVAEMAQVVQTWPLAFQAGEVQVYRNPAR